MAVKSLLTDTKVKNAKPGERPYKLGDGGWLYLLVKPSSAKLWRMAYRYAGREKLLALGARAAEMPVTHGERLAGSSKLKVLATSADMARFLLYLRWKVRLLRAGVIQSL